MTYIAMKMCSIFHLMRNFMNFWIKTESEKPEIRSVSVPLDETIG